MSRGSVLHASPIRFCWSGGFFFRHCHISLALIVRIGPFVSASALRHVFSTNLPKINKQLINNIGVHVDSPSSAYKDTPCRAGNKGIWAGCFTELGGKKRRRYRATARSSIWFAFPLQECNATLRRWPRGGRLQRVPHCNDEERVIHYEHGLCPIPSAHHVSSVDHSSDCTVSVFSQ